MSDRTEKPPLTPKELDWVIQGLTMLLGVGVEPETEEFDRIEELSDRLVEFRESRRRRKRIAEMKGQRTITFPKQVVRFVTGDYTSEEEVMMPLFRELSTEEETAFRQHARENYRIGGEISEVFHPVWADEARKMNEEASRGER